MTSFLWRSVLLLCVVANVAAQDCAGDARSTDASRFDDNHDGTLTDIDTGLTWMRCALGLRWDGNTCQGQVDRYDWQAAQQAARRLNERGGLAGNSDWRLPRLPELAGIAERHCKDPRINLQLFPATPAALFWTVSGKPGLPDQAYALDFGPRGVVTVYKADRYPVRLVRGGLW